MRKFGGVIAPLNLRNARTYAISSLPGVKPATTRRTGEIAGPFNSTVLGSGIPRATRHAGVSR
jgi:hypothetical protein